VTLYRGQVASARMQRDEVDPSVGFNVVSYERNSQLYSRVYVYWIWPPYCFPSGKEVEVVTNAMILACQIENQAHGLEYVGRLTSSVTVNNSSTGA
jgi:hypothetical protein